MEYTTKISPSTEHGLEFEVLTLGKSTELTMGPWGVWPEWHGTETR